MFEEQKNTIANQHGLEGDSPELHQILTDMKNRINEYIVHGALLKCTKGTHKNRGILINGKEIQSNHIRVEENSRIRIVENRKATINGLTPASIEDCKGGMRDAKNNLEFNDKEGINMLSSLYCKFGKGIITAQESGQELGKTTTVYPVGICFYDFDTAAVDAMKGQQSNINQFNLTADSQDLVAMLCFAECYNGKGYYNKGRNSPYI